MINHASAHLWTTVYILAILAWAIVTNTIITVGASHGRMQVVSFFNFSLVTLLIICTFLYTPSNRSTRLVYETQLLTLDESAEIISMADGKAWSNDRHANYPTVDVKLAQSFSLHELERIQKILDGRPKTFIETTLGVKAACTKADDVFVVKYDSRGQGADFQTFLARHTDGGFFSINILLGGEFNGGGTRFLNRRLGADFTEASATALNSFNASLSSPNDIGRGLLHRGKLFHEGLPISSGVRYIMVAFMSINTKLPSCSLSVFESYLNLGFLESWADQYHTALKELRSDLRKVGARETPVQSYMRKVSGVLRYIAILLADTVSEWKDHTVVLEQLPESKDKEGTVKWFDMNDVFLDASGAYTRTAN